MSNEGGWMIAWRWRGSRPIVEKDPQVHEDLSFTEAYYEAVGYAPKEAENK